MAQRDTRGDTTRAPSTKSERCAGVIVAFSRTPRFLVFRAEPTLRVGRDDAIGALLDDERLSRHHAEIAVRGDDFVVRDLGSRNGTFVDGEPITGEHVVRAPAIVRAGGTVMLLASDVSKHIGRHISQDDSVIVGTIFGDALAEVERAGRAGDALLLRGETGTGKEIAARRYHDATAFASGPLRTFNCATIPEGLAERLLFGAKRGAYSGAINDVEGIIQSADGGTLFLDEIGELDIDVQAKLLRVLETREVVPLGGARPVKVDVRFCFATHRDLRVDVASSRFRADLFYRLGDREVLLPPLRDRREDVPWLLAFALGAEGTALHPRFVEACMLRSWPGNVRELLREARRAAEKVANKRAASVRVEHLDPSAGEPITDAHGAHALPTSPTQAAVRAALGAASGNISEAARTLGVHRTQLRRAMRKLGLSAGKA